MPPHDIPTSDWLISVDDHVIEPPDLWVDRVPAADRERAPHVRYDDELGYLLWQYGDYRTPIPNTIVQAGTDREALVPRFLASYDEMDPACYQAKARLGVMDTDGVLASLCFPMFPRFCGQTFYEAPDRDFALVCVQAYNDWVIEDWGGTDPARLLPLIIVPLWDPTLAAREVERCAGLGAKAIAFSENPWMLGLPSLHDEGDYWDPLLAAANDTGLPLCVHLGSSSSVPSTSPDAPLLVTGSLSNINLAAALADWLFCGKLIDGDRQPYPDLKVCLSEGGIGWIPYMLERCDQMVESRPFAARGDFKIDIAKGGTSAIYREGVGRRFGVPPSEVFRRHVYGCFIDDEFGCRNLVDVGVDNVMIETDYPHGDSTYPGSLARAHERLAPLDESVRHAVLQGTARRVFQLDS
jgi:predicted TIM-barrel fold metal-dependent hydrolase